MVLNMIGNHRGIFVDNNQILDFDKICRLCCAEASMLSVFKVHIHKKITACTGIQVWQNDGMPHQICKKCMSKLHIAFQFKKQCENSDFRLRQYKLNEKFAEKRAKNGQQEDTEELQQEEPLQQIEELGESLPPELPPLPPDYSYNDPLPLSDNRHYDTLHNLNLGPYDLPTEPQFIFNGNSILANMTNVNIPLQGNVHMPANYNIQSINTIQSNTSFQNSFTIHALGPPTGIPTQVLTLDDPPVPDVDTAIITEDLLPYNESGEQDEEQVNTEPAPEEKKDPRPAYVFHKMGCLKVRSKKDIEDNRCPICNKAFASNGKLTRHMKTHGDKPFKCKVCKKTFAHHGNFKVHMRVHNDERPFSCSMCNMACRQQQDLDKHMRTHTGERPHVCSTCDKAFATSSNLVVHERTHTGVKPYVCSVCSKGFCQSNELTKHMRTHTGEKSHTCPECEKGFNGSSTLIVHLRSHTGERPYVCTICRKGFTQSSGLAAHARSHSALSGYQCARCPRAFPTISERRRHQSAHGLANLPCPHCHRRFSRTNDLVRHSRVHERR